MKKKIIALCLAVCLIAIAAVTGTMAYLTDKDQATNVMTIGNVDIEQKEYQRDENGALEEFEDELYVYPAVGEIEYLDETLDVNGYNAKIFALNNARDKIITVENTGNAAAYVRTIILIEAPGFDAKDLIHLHAFGSDDGYTGVINWSNIGTITIDGVDYVYLTATYVNALAPTKESAPSLVQVFLDSKATNEDLAAYGPTWEIIAISQAVQADGFDDAATALNAAFGEVNNDNLPGWVDATNP